PDEVLGRREGDEPDPRRRARDHRRTARARRGRVALPGACAERLRDRRLPRDLPRPGGAAPLLHPHPPPPPRAPPRRAGSARLAPGELFALTGPGKIDTADGTFDITQASASRPLGLLPRGAASEAATEALSRLTRETIYRDWLRDEETRLLSTASCLNDQVPR